MKQQGDQSWKNVIETVKRSTAPGQERRARRGGAQHRVEEPRRGRRGPGQESRQRRRRGDRGDPRQGRGHAREGQDFGGRRHRRGARPRRRSLGGDRRIRARESLGRDRNRRRGRHRDRIYRRTSLTRARDGAPSMRTPVAALVPAILRHLQAYADVAGEDARDAVACHRAAPAGASDRGRRRVHRAPDVLRLDPRARLGYALARLGRGRPRARLRDRRGRPRDSGPARTAESRMRYSSPASVPSWTATGNCSSAHSATTAATTRQTAVKGSMQPTGIERRARGARRR